MSDVNHTEQALYGDLNTTCAFFALKKSGIEVESA